MKKSIVLVLVVLMTVSMLLAGCGNDSTASESAASQEASASATGESAPAADASEGGTGTVSGKIGILMPSVVVARWADDAKSMEEAAKAIGLETEVQFADDAIETQVMQIENMVTKGYKALIICPVNAEALTEVLGKAKKAGVTVISYDRLIQGTEDVDYYVTFDNIKVGEVCGQYIVDALDLETNQGPFNLEIFTGDIADNNAKMTLEGGMNILQPYIDNGQLVVKSGQTTLEQTATKGWATGEAQNRMDNIMSGFYTSDKLDAIFSTYGGMSLGCIASLQALGYGTDEKPMPIITAQDGELAIVQAVANGTLSMSLFKDTRALAKQAIDLTAASLKGETVELDASKFYDNGAFEVPTVLLDPIPFDKSNLDKVMIEDSGYWTKEDIYG
ncbi:sugar-binding protein [Christensenella timonensis]|uniref:substrate-binding domain-containing protein n=1 Tax=Christensenella timonensis TaxID=1816678 RepID=UPI00083090FD|nr:sugar-binding protein [Christensenella timonensis]